MLLVLLKIKTKNYNTYQIKGLFPKEIENYPLIPLRKVDVYNKHFEDMTEAELKEYQMGDTFNELNYYFTVNKEADDILLAK